MNEDDVVWINTVRINTPTGDMIVNESIYVPNDPGNIQYLEVMFWDTLPGNTITPYDPYYGMSVEQAQEIKYGEMDAYNQGLMDIANANPYAGNSTRPFKNRSRVNNRNNTAAGGNPPGQVKQRDKALVEYSDEVLDANDAATVIVEGMSDVTQIMALEIAIIVAWPIWFPPA